ncbi:toll-like receptor 2 type-2 [Stegostoma tigrinum]|uniref:toll-like receptor 2 type-2 n=1 Tax=Stegostoma tigrinum TaxID=3053191 RepID=UPI00286FD8C7|nr:toll-like receptor 2 type-2 [Stegostoma tigrinum]XP_059501412.1 toll-like receptor 2 type-2 [Stegostoma tigrinum]XP_059501415.1 toll-like receptor 2 type-2 [Stegostoma tigrinum]XP_059501419.1 toll-like receptor 2 type-2 [Stegostoma tigrinum]XP_059501424.1 toll-like receptor 2 type-2 [Stegostoma tigrinum]
MSSPSLLILLVDCIFVHAAFFEGNTDPSNICQKCISHNFCNCSSVKLENVPRVVENVLRFDLSHNEISQIKDTDFIIYVKLKRLQLQSNRIHSISEQAFQHNTDLEYLDLSNNLLTCLSPHWFERLPKLQYLNILGNNYTDLGSGRIFSNLTRLRWLEFGNPSLSVLKKGDFVGVAHLDEFIVTAEKLQVYEKGSFSSFSSISHASLSLPYTFLNKPSQAQQIFVDLSELTTHMELRNVAFPDKRDNQPFLSVQNSSLRKLSFRNTFLTENTVINFLSSVKNTEVSELVVKDSELSGVGKWYGIDNLKTNSLDTILLSNISIKHFYLFHDLSSISDLFQSIKNATFTKLTMFLMPCTVSKKLKDMEYLDLTDNLLSDRSLDETVCSGAWRSLRYLILRKNLFKSLARTSTKLTTLPKLIHLDLSQNRFSDIKTSCKWSEKLQFLNLSSCTIKNIEECVPPNVEVLDLSNNIISSFAVNLPSLKELNLSNNKLKSLPGDGYLPKMEILKISSNKLTSLSAEEVKTFQKLQFLEAGRNNYICSCEFLFSMNNGMTVELLDRAEDYICDSPLILRGKMVQNTKRSFFDCHKTLSLALLCVGTILTVVIVVVMCYKYHVFWYIQMTWAWLKAKRKPKNVKNNNICYDAFVSYSQMDSEWVENLLVSELESAHPPLTLCLHKRDFIPGKWIIDNIIESIEKSRKTLFVLSQHFVQSEWCKYELDYTHFRLFDENDDSAILVLLEVIPKETIPQRFCKLRKLMNTKTYLEWPQDEVGQQVFWFNLRIALQGDNITSL